MTAAACWRLAAVSDVTRGVCRLVGRRRQCGHGSHHPPHAEHPISTPTHCGHIAHSRRNAPSDSTISQENPKVGVWERTAVVWQASGPTLPPTWRPRERSTLPHVVLPCSLIPIFYTTLMALRSRNNRHWDPLTSWPRILHRTAHSHGEDAGGSVLAACQHIAAIRGDRQVLDRVTVASPRPHTRPRSRVPAAHDAIQAPAEHQGLGGVLRQPRHALRERQGWGGSDQAKPADQCHAAVAAVIAAALFPARSQWQVRLAHLPTCNAQVTHTTAARTHAPLGEGTWRVC